MMLATVSDSRVRLSEIGRRILADGEGAEGQTPANTPLPFSFFSFFFLSSFQGVFWSTANNRLDAGGTNASVSNCTLVFRVVGTQGYQVEGVLHLLIYRLS